MVPCSSGRVLGRTLDTYQLAGPQRGTATSISTTTGTTSRRTLTPVQARALLVAASEERLEALVVTGLMLGLGPGELTGLLWSDLDLEAGTLTVARSMKRERGSLRLGPVKRSRAGHRSIDLPIPVLDALRAHRTRQVSERLSAGPLWQDEGLVFCSEIGTALDPSNVRRTFDCVCRRAGLGHWTPYELRHSAASLLIDAGVPLEQVADLLGDDPRTLLRHYRHRVRPTVDAAKAPMEAMFGTG
ncbi:MAG: site-specific integrase [Acidimicrobiales bacterium]